MYPQKPSLWRRTLPNFNNNNNKGICKMLNLVHRDYSKRTRTFSRAVMYLQSCMTIQCWKMDFLQSNWKMKSSDSDTKILGSNIYEALLSRSFCFLTGLWCGAEQTCLSDHSTCLWSHHDLALRETLRIPCHLGTGIAQWLERRTRDWKVPGSNPCRSGGRIFFSRVDFLCWL